MFGNDTTIKIGGFGLKVKQSFSMFIAALLICSLPLQTVLASEKEIELADEAKSAILIERDTGAILYSKNQDEQLSPASMTKIMTMLLIIDRKSVE